MPSLQGTARSERDRASWDARLKSGYGPSPMRGAPEPLAVQAQRKNRCRNGQTSRRS
jgi:hypothetical protein